MGVHVAVYVCLYIELIVNRTELVTGSCVPMLNCCTNGLKHSVSLFLLVLVGCKVWHHFIIFLSSPLISGREALLTETQKV